MNNKREKILSWIDEMEKYAHDNKLPSRIMDRLVECKDGVHNGTIPWEQVCLEIEDIIVSVEKKALAEAKQTDDGKGSVSMQEVEAQLKKMAERCHNENQVSVLNAEERKKSVLAKCFGQLREITRTEAHIRELKRGAMYVRFFEDGATGYQTEILSVLRDMVSDISSNYTHMLEHMKSMFCSIKHPVLGNEKAFYELEEKQTLLEKRVLNTVANSDVGKNDIISFAQRTGAKIKGIVKRYELKRKILTWLPVLVIILVVVGSSILGGNKSAAVTEASDTEAQMSESGQAVIDFVEGKLTEQLSNAMDGLSEAIGALTIPFLIALIAIVMIVIVLYRLYIKGLQKSCDRAICQRCEEYLLKEFISFEQGDSLKQRMDEIIKDAVSEYEQQYLQLLNETFRISGQESERCEADTLSVLKETWKQIS